jgi:diguanylate cyclase (GGDEF)-like protein
LHGARSELAPQKRLRIATRIDALKQVFDSFVPPMLDDRLQTIDEHRRGRILVRGCFFGAAALLVIFALRTLMLGHAGKLMPLYLLTIGVFAATPLVLRKTGSLRIASSLPLLLICLCFPVVASRNGGPFAPVMALMPAFSLLALAFAPPRLARLMTLLLVLEGLVLLLMHRNGHVFSNELSVARRMDLSVVSTLAATIATFSIGYLLDAHRAIVEQRLDEARSALYEASTRDALTQIHNRRYFEERMVAELAFARRQKTPLSLVLLDVDYFKRINDSYGHAAGDAVLRELAARFRTTLRHEDVLARYGGEEFAVGLRGISIDNARVVAERLRAAAAAPIAFGDRVLQCTASAGCASMQHDGTETTLASLAEVADKRLYAAKQRGRDNVVCAE